MSVNIQSEDGVIKFGSSEKFKIKKDNVGESLSIITKTSTLAIEESVKVEDGKVTLLNPTTLQTLSQNTNDKTLATTELAQSILGNRNITEPSTNYTIAASTTPVDLNYSHCGKFLQLVGNIASTWNAPSPVNKKGYCLLIWNNTNFLLTLNTVAGGFFNTSNNIDADSTRIYATCLTEFCSDGLNWVKINEIFPDSYKLKQAYFISATGQYIPSNGVRYYEAYIQGSGGAGGGSGDTGINEISMGAGGGAGGLLLIRSTDLSTVNIVIGVGGNGVVNGTGGSGGTVTFGTTSVSGGQGGALSGILAAGTTNGFSVGGTGGKTYTLQASHNFLNFIPGQNGSHGFYSSNGSLISGAGGDSFFGPGSGWVGLNISGISASASSYGAGGSGAASLTTVGIARAGGNGAAGIVFVREFV